MSDYLRLREFLYNLMFRHVTPGVVQDLISELPDGDIEIVKVGKDGQHALREHADFCARELMGKSWNQDHGLACNDLSGLDCWMTVHVTDLIKEFEKEPGMEQLRVAPMRAPVDSFSFAHKDVVMQKSNAAISRIIAHCVDKTDRPGLLKTVVSDVKSEIIEAIKDTPSDSLFVYRPYQVLLDGRDSLVFRYSRMVMSFFED